MGVTLRRGIFGKVCAITHDVDRVMDRMLTICAAKDEWLPTWGEGNDRGMTVRSVKMWQHGKC
jgi:hypothetical protein